jgi:hypothetical protein
VAALFSHLVFVANRLDERESPHSVALLQPSSSSMDLWVLQRSQTHCRRKFHPNDHPWSSMLYFRTDLFPPQEH